MTCEVANGRRGTARRGSTLDGHTRPSAIAARDNFARYNPHSWLDSGGAVQGFVPPSVFAPTGRTERRPMNPDYSLADWVSYRGTLTSRDY